jgi:hypothetical protein
MGHHSAADLTAASGYQNFNPTASPDEASKFNGYQAAQISPGLSNQLAAQTTGAGPSLAQGQLQQGTQQNLAGQLAAQASQRGNQTAGQGMRNLGNQAAATNQQAAGQAAGTRAQEQMGAQSQLGQLATSQAGLNQQANQFNAQGQQNLAGLQQQQNEFQNQLGFNVQNAQNQADLSFAMANNNAGNQLTQSAMNSLSGAASSAAMAFAAHGKVIDMPMFADGGLVDQSGSAQSASQMEGLLRNLQAYHNFSPPQKFDESAPSASSSGGGAAGAGAALGGAAKGAMAPDSDYTGKSIGTASPNISPGQLSTPIDPAAYGGQMQLQSPELTQAAGGTGPSANLGLGEISPAYAKGGVLDGPTVLPTGKGPVVAGEAGREAVVPMGDKAAIVPVKGDGEPDEDRAKDPKIQALLRHPDFLAALKQATGSAVQAAMRGDKNE